MDNPAGATLDAAYRAIQALFARGLVTLLGSGASCAHGLPSMGALSNYLQETLSASSGVSSEDAGTTEDIIRELSNGTGLESVLRDKNPSDHLLAVIRQQIARCIRDAEVGVIQGLIQDPGSAVYGELFKLILRVNHVAEVVTTNYDRLVEVSAAIHGLRVDTMFAGHTVGRLDKQGSADELLSRMKQCDSKRRTSHALARHIRLAKPHGSLDWVEWGGTVYRTDLPVDFGTHIIAPAGSKYREGYGYGFHEHIARMNEAIERASGLLCIGYGFNDDHLQTRIESKLASLPCLIMAKQLTPQARRLITNNSNAIGIEELPHGTGATVIYGNSEASTSAELWRLQVLLSEVLSDKGEGS